VQPTAHADLDLVATAALRGEGQHRRDRVVPAQVFVPRHVVLARLVKVGLVAGNLFLQYGLLDRRRVACLKDGAQSALRTDADKERPALARRDRIVSPDVAGLAGL